MRLVLYNIRYGTGASWHFHLPVPFSGYLKLTGRNVGRITEFLRSEQPDIVGLIEVDGGSYRSRLKSQAVQIAETLGFDHVYESKYSRRSLAKCLPVLRKQGNALLTNQSIHATDIHYFKHGIKRMAIELELESCVIFLVHLSLLSGLRQSQLRDLYHLFRESSKPVIVAGDFNALWGERELDLFLAASGLRNANIEGRPTYPSRRPRRQLDFVLHSPGVRVTDFRIPDVRLSDHMPIVCDFELLGGTALSASDGPLGQQGSGAPPAATPGTAS